MKNIFLFLGVFLFTHLYAAEYKYDYSFFQNSRMKGYYYYTNASYTSPSWVKHARHHLPVSEAIFNSPGNSLELTFLSAGTGDWSAEVQYCPVRGNDFFKVPSVLSLMLRMEEGTENVLPEIAIRFKNKTYTAYLSLSSYLQHTSKVGDWYKINIPLKDFGISAIDDANIKEFAALAFKGGKADGKIHTLFLDDIELLPAVSPAQKLQAPVLKEAKAYERHIDISWNQPKDIEDIKYYKVYRSLDGVNFFPIGIQHTWMNRYTDFLGETDKKAYYKVTAVDYAFHESPASSVYSATTYPMTDEQLLDMVQEASFRYYWEGAEPNSGMARENIPGRKDMIATGASGFGSMAVLVAAERGFITREEARNHFLKMTSFLKKAEKYHGVVPHFMDGTTGKTVSFFGTKDNGGDLVENSFLFQALLAVRQYFDGNQPEEKQICKNIDQLWNDVEWNWYKQYQDSPYLYWHWSPDQHWVINHKLIGWNETMITYLLAIMSPSHSVAPEMYYTGWASQAPEAQAYREDWSKVPDGKMYVNNHTYFGEKLDIGTSNGGPLFFVHYSFMGLDPHRFSDKYTNYFENNRKMALINYRYCMENQGGFVGYGEDCWGLTASDFSWGYQAQEPMPHRDNGTIAPTGALASFPYTPEESMKALKNYYRNYGEFLWGEYGFRDAFNLTENWVSPLFMGLNQAPVTVMIENYRTGLVWNLFMSHPDVKKGIKKIESLTNK